MTSDTTSASDHDGRPSRQARRHHARAGLVGASVMLVLASCAAGSAAPQVIATGPIGANAAASAGGSTTVPGQAAGPSAPGAAPLVGDCRGPSSARTIDPPTDPRPTVPCDGVHGAETFFVGTLPDTVTTWPTAQDTVIADLVTQIGQQCQPVLADYIGLVPGPSGTQTLTRVDLAFYLPTSSEFAAGARWFRCDAVVYPFASDAETTIPGTLKDAFTGRPPAPELLVCEGAAGDRLACSLPHRAELLEALVLPEGADTAYPGSAALGTWVDQLCLPRVRELLAQRGELRNDLGLLDYWPTAESWAGGDRTALCGASVVANELVTGTLRGIGSGKLAIGGIQA